MGPGLPGLGIASVFYVIAALFAPLRELALTIRGRSSAERWRLVGIQFLLAVTVVVALIAFYVGLAMLVRVGWLPRPREWNALARLPNVVWAFLTLAAVLTGVWLYALWDRVTSEEETLEMIAAAHRSGVVNVVIDLREAAPAAPELAATGGRGAPVGSVSPTGAGVVVAAPMWAAVHYPDDWSTLPHPEVERPSAPETGPVGQPGQATPPLISWDDVAAVLSSLPLARGAPVGV